MNAPRRIRPLSMDDTNFVPMMRDGNLFSAGDARDRMVVPDRIVIAGGNELVAEKQPPPEIALDMRSYVPGDYGQHSLLETPPAKLTLQNRAFPTVDETEYFRQQQRVIQSNSETAKLDSLNEEKQEQRQQQQQKISPMPDGLPPTAVMSVLSPSEELVLLRNHVRKLTTRLQKLEEEIQDTNRHVTYIEYIGGALVLLMTLKKIHSIFFEGIV